MNSDAGSCELPQSSKPPESALDNIYRATELFCTKAEAFAHTLDNDPAAIAQQDVAASRYVRASECCKCVAEAKAVRDISPAVLTSLA